MFVFVNRRRTHLKLLVFERGGFVIYYKRLEQGTFELPAAGSGSSERLSWPELMLMLEGIALQSVRYRKRYAPVQAILDTVGGGSDVPSYTGRVGPW